MNDKIKKEHPVYHLPPCSAYDVAGMESWLAVMAQKGLFLAKDGFFAGIAAFEKGKPQTIKYRLEAADKNTSIWSDGGGEPDSETIELEKKYDWEYVGKRGSFYIYRSCKIGERELSTKLEAQALAVNAVRKRQAGTAFKIFFFLIFYPFLLIRGRILLTMINAGTWFFLFTSFLVFWLFIGSLIKIISLGRLQKKFRTGFIFEPIKDWNKRAIIYYTKNTVKIIMIITWVCISLHKWSVSVMDEDKISLENYKKNPPFATMADFAGNDYYSYQMGMLGRNFNTVQDWSDWLAPRNIKWSEQAEITCTDGTILEGGLTVYYHETISPFIAERLALEYYQIDKRKSFVLLDTPAFDVDYAAAYINNLHFPTILIQNDNIVVHATFYQISSDYKMELAEWEWAYLIADSISRK